MPKPRCKECNKRLKLTEIVVKKSDSEEFFCAGELSPLEPGSCALKYLERNPANTKGCYFFISLKEYRDSQVRALAKEQGFTEFVGTLKGHGSYLVYSNGETNRVYDPLECVKLYDYNPFHRKVSTKFRNPELLVKVNPRNLKDYVYSRKKQPRKE